MEKKPIFKKWWFWVIVVLVIAVIGAAAGGGGGTSADDEPGSSQQAAGGSSEVPDDSATEPPTESEDVDPTESDKAIESGRYTLPGGMSVNFSDSVRNDVTGNWRISTTSDSAVPADYALEYYETLFSSDDEIHAIWNATLGTTTRITASLGILFVDTFEYVDGEEHDAKLLFTGELLDSKMISIETGELLDLD